MKIGNITNKSYNPSFGLKICKNQGYEEFIMRASGKNWQCSEEDIKDFNAKLEDMHFANESSDNTGIAFAPAVREFAGYRTIPSPTYRNRVINEPCYVSVMPCTLFKTSGNNQKIAHFGIQLNGSSLDSILTEIATNYARYIYGNE